MPNPPPYRSELAQSAHEWITCACGDLAYDTNALECFQSFVESNDVNSDSWLPERSSNGYSHLQDILRLPRIFAVQSCAGVQAQNKLSGTDAMGLSDANTSPLRAELERGNIKVYLEEAHKKSKRMFYTLMDSNAWEKLSPDNKKNVLIAPDHTGNTAFMDAVKLGSEGVLKRLYQESQTLSKTEFLKMLAQETDEKKDLLHIALETHSPRLVRQVTDFWQEMLDQDDPELRETVRNALEHSLMQTADDGRNKIHLLNENSELLVPWSQKEQGDFIKLYQAAFEEKADVAMQLLAVRPVKAPDSNIPDSEIHGEINLLPDNDRGSPDKRQMG